MARFSVREHFSEFRAWPGQYFCDDAVRGLRFPRRLLCRNRIVHGARVPDPVRIARPCRGRGREPLAFRRDLRGRRPLPPLARLGRLARSGVGRGRRLFAPLGLSHARGGLAARHDHEHHQSEGPDFFFLPSSRSSSIREQRPGPYGARWRSWASHSSHALWRCFRPSPFSPGLSPQSSTIPAGRSS